MADSQPDQPVDVPALPGLPVRLAVAAGLVVAGVAALVVAWVFGEDFVSPEPGPGWVRAATVALVVLVGVRVWLGLSSSDGRIAAWVTLGIVVIALVTAVLAVLGWVDQHRRGFPGQATVLAAVGGLAVAAGALLSPRRVTRRRPGMAASLAAGVAMLLVTAVAVPLTLSTPGWTVSATAAAPTTVPPFPEAVSEVAWSISIDGPIRDVVAAGAGVVLLVDDGVIALDSTTGQIRWARHRRGADAGELDASPDGKTVVVKTSPDDDLDRLDTYPILREVIDAFTGQVRFTIPDRNAMQGPHTVMTGATYIGVDVETGIFVAFHGYSLVDGSRLWTFRVPAECWVRDSSEWFGVSTGLMLPLLCGQRDGNGEFIDARYVSLDGSTGRQRWQRTVPLDKPRDYVRVDGELSVDGHHLSAEVTTLGSEVLGRFIIDTETGADVPAPPPLELKSAGMAVERPAERGGAGRLIDLTSGAPVATGEVARCASSLGAAILKSGVVCVRSSSELRRQGLLWLDEGRFGETSPRTMVIRLGDRFAQRGGNVARLVAAPGAVVATTEFNPFNGQVNVVGLR